MSPHLIFFAIDVIGCFSVLSFGLHVLLSAPKLLNARLIAFICFNSAAAILLARQEFGHWIPEAFQLHVGILQIPFHVMRNLTPGLLMVLCHSLFQDNPKFPRWLLVAFALQVVMEISGTLRVPGGYVPQYDWTRATPALLQLLFIGYALYWLVQGWQSDLVEARRKLRLSFLIILGAYIFVAILLERLLIPWDSVAAFYTHLALSIMGTVLVTFGLFATLRWDQPIYIDPFRDEKHDETPTESSQNTLARENHPAIAALQRVFKEDRIYRDGELSVASLAVKLAMPEYRLRKLIHEQLGYRNFNALLHEYRIAEACQDLSDPAKSHLPILTIALTVGYNSINPFNRAFRDAKGVTPSAFRTQVQATAPKNTSPIP
jgi:AraC-like DNA-binding protein